jgi:hypothetical protein
MGEKLQNLKPREGKGFMRGQPREAKPFTRMAKWEIRFQRFALSFRPLASITEKVILCQYSGLTRSRNPL